MGLSEISADRVCRPSARRIPSIAKRPDPLGACFQCGMGGQSLVTECPVSLATPPQSGTAGTLGGGADPAAPLKVLRLTLPPLAAGVGLVLELAPRHQGVTTEENVPSAAWGWHSGLAAKQNKSAETFLYPRLRE